MPPNIGDSYPESIGRTYTDPEHTQNVSRGTHRTVWARLKEALHDRGLPQTQAYAAKLAGVEQPSVSDWNKPGNYPTMENAVLLCKRTGVCVEWLLLERGPKYPGPPGDRFAQEVWSLWGDLSADDKRDLVGHARWLQGRKEQTATVPNPRSPSPAPVEAPSIRASED